MHTYCNPLYVVDYPRGHGGDSDRPWQRDYRSLADPEVIFWEGKWYMYPTYRLAFQSDDMVHWEPMDVTPQEVGPAPTVMVHGGKFYLSGGDQPLYVGQHPNGPFQPLGNFRLPNGDEMIVRDTMLFADDDGSIYLYWGLGAAGIFGAQLSAENPAQLVTEPVQLIAFHPEYDWERFGEYNQSYGKTYLEGAYLLKEQGKYYLVYSAPGTCYGSYCLAAYVSAQGPLAGFRCQKRNPILTTRQGLVRGTGHGSFARAKDHSLWCFYTIALCYEHKYERRIAMDRAGIDDHGELYVQGATSVPCLAPDETGTQPHWLPLTAFNPTCASSNALGRECIYAVDESQLTWWQPAAEDQQPELTISLRAYYHVYSYRLLWKDVGLDYSQNCFPGAFGYVLEAYEGKTWKTVADHRQNDRDVLCVYEECIPCTASKIRIRITDHPQGITPGIVQLTAFGTFSKDEA